MNSAVFVAIMKDVKYLTRNSTFKKIRYFILYKKGVGGKTSKV